ncbi:MAG TPA: septal ring lytic transglycosylase RlpA family protein [Alphaproteobacteria bacterium]|jgi:rare lipoprotein A|nr:septal ring lytic transglycosylase RlpA family protein [Alphaproteobacteria bacterium]
MTKIFAKYRQICVAAAMLAVFGLGACATQEKQSQEVVAAPVAPARPAPAPQVVHREEGIASWYGGRHHGRRTASGQRFDMNAMTAAHRKLPMFTRVRVMNLENGRSIEVVINDRGPYIKGRIIDLSSEAARRLEMRRQGTARVRVEVLDDGTKLAKPKG